MKINTRHIVSFFLLSTAFFACVDVYDIEISSNKGYLLVDGIITDLDEPQRVTIARTPDEVTYFSTKFTSTIVATQKKETPVSGANVRLIVNEAEEIPLREMVLGSYELPTTFKAKIGDKYQLIIKTAEGETYESSVEQMNPVAAITNVYDEFNKTGIKKIETRSELVSTNDIYIDFDDTPNEKNFYRWRWINYELQRICETCKQGRYNVYQSENGETGDCFRDPTLSYNNEYDYTCGSQCWDIFYSTDINIFADVYTDGQPQKNKRVAQIPLRQLNTTMVKIHQMSLTPNAYRYYKLIQDQSVNVGTLADTPPAPIRSNIVNTKNSDELVLGYFSASAVAEVNYMLFRKNAIGGAFNNLFMYVNKRGPIFEYESVERQLIPAAYCKNSKYRTPYMPMGWRP